MRKELDDIIKSASEEELFNILKYLEEDKLATILAEEILKTSSLHIERDAAALAELIHYITEDPIIKIAAATRGEAHPIRNWLLFWFGKPTDDRNSELQDYGAFYSQCEKLLGDMKEYKESYGKERVEQFKDELNKRAADVKEFATTSDKKVVEKFINKYAKQYTYDAVNNKIIKDYDKYGIGLEKYSSSNKKLRDKYNSVRLENVTVDILETAIKWLDERLATLVDQINSHIPYDTNLFVHVEQGRAKGTKHIGYIVTGLEDLIKDAQDRYNEYKELTTEKESHYRDETTRYNTLNGEIAEKNKEFLKIQAYYDVLNKSRTDITSALQREIQKSKTTVDEATHQEIDNNIIQLKQVLQENSEHASDTDVKRRSLYSELSSKNTEMMSLKDILGEYPKIKHSEKFYNTKWKGWSKYLGAVEEERDKVLLAYTKLMPNGMEPKDYVKYLQEQTVQAFLNEGKEPTKEEINKVVSDDLAKMVSEAKSILSMDIPAERGKRHKYDIYKEKLELNLPQEDIESFIPPEELQEADIDYLRKQSIPVLQDRTATEALLLSVNESIKNSVNTTYNSITEVYGESKKSITNLLSSIDSKTDESADYTIDEEGKKIDSIKTKYSGDLQHAQLFGNELRNLTNKLLKQNEDYNKKNPESPKSVIFDASIIDALSLGGEKNVPTGKRRNLMNNIGNALEFLSKYFLDAGEKEVTLRRDYGITKDMFTDAIKEILTIGTEARPVEEGEYDPFGVSKIDALIEKVDSIPIEEVKEKDLFPTKFSDVGKELDIVDPKTGKNKKTIQTERINIFSGALKSCRDSIKKFSYTMLTDKLESIDTILDAINNTVKTNFFDSNALVEMLGASQKEKKSLDGKTIQEKTNIRGDLGKVPILSEILSEPEMISFREKLMSSAKDRDNQIKNLLESVTGQLSNLLDTVNKRKKEEIANAETKYGDLFGNMGKVKTLRNDISTAESELDHYKKFEPENQNKINELQKTIVDKTGLLEEELKNYNEPEKYRNLIETILFPQMQFVTSMVDDITSTTRKIRVSPAQAKDPNWYSLTQLLRNTILECKRSIAGCANNKKDYTYASKTNETSPMYREVPSGPIHSEIEQLKSEKLSPETKAEIDKLNNILIKIQNIPKTEHAQKELDKLTIQYNKKHDIALEKQMDVLRDFLNKNNKMTSEERNTVLELKEKYKNREEHPEFIKYREELQREIDYIDNRIYVAIKKKHDIELPWNKPIEEITADFKSEIKNIEDKLKNMKLGESKVQSDLTHRLNELNLKYKDLIKIPTPVKIQEMSDDRSLMWTVLFKFKYSSPEKISEKDIEDTKLILESVVKKRKEETEAPNIVKKYSQ